MQTQLIKIDPQLITFNKYNQPLYNNSTFPKEFLEACKQLKQGQSIIGLPTETVYGLGANALNENSVQSIFKTKGRPNDNPLIIHISSINMLTSLIDSKIGIPSQYLPIIEKFWPGPLTLLFKKSASVPYSVTGGHETVAIRFPSHPVARAIIALSEVPIAAPSANLSGKPSPTEASHVLEDLNEKIPYIIDAGSCQVGLESTVLDGLMNPPTILRPGQITLEMIKSIVGFENTQVYKRKGRTEEEVRAIEQCPTTPGMKYTHYSPEAMVVALDPVFDSKKFDLTQIVLNSKEEVLKHYHLNFKNPLTKIGIILNEKYSIDQDCLIKNFELKELVIEKIFDDIHHLELGKYLFKLLRKMDHLNVDLVYFQGVKDVKMGTAIMNRLRKASKLVIEY